MIKSNKFQRMKKLRGYEIPVKRSKNGMIEMDFSIVNIHTTGSSQDSVNFLHMWIHVREGIKFEQEKAESIEQSRY